MGNTSGTQNNFVAVPFNTVGYNTADIQQIQISGDGIGWGGEGFEIWSGAPTVVEGSSFLYCDPTLDPNAEATDYYWGDYDGYPASYSIAAGQGVVLGLSEGLEISYAGEVANDGVEFTSVGGNNFVGNTFASAIDIQNIRISGDGLGWGGEGFEVWEGAPTVKEGSSFLYCDPSLDPNAEATDYYWGDYDGNRVTYSIVPGQGFVLGLPEGVTVSFDAPY